MTTARTNAATSRGRAIPPAGIVRPLRAEASAPILQTDEQADAFAVGMIAIAEEVEQAEDELWAAVERHAEAGEIKAVLAIARNRRTSPPCEAVKLLAAPPTRAA